jgi:hypothetical protein
MNCVGVNCVGMNCVGVNVGLSGAGTMKCAR